MQLRLLFVGLGITVILFITCETKPESSQNKNIMEQNKEVVKQYVEKFNASDLIGLKSVFAESAQVYGVLGWGKVDDVMPIWKQLFDGLAIQLKIEEIIAEGDLVAASYTESGTSRALFLTNQQPERVIN